MKKLKFRELYQYEHGDGAGGSRAERRSRHASSGADRSAVYQLSWAELELDDQTTMTAKRDVDPKANIKSVHGSVPSKHPN
ncbi:hypothetical protein NECAME_03073 [Necator americanus]|uniref:Uncharacterized protein n=1 Tax=Necator americanus TaxID=51031 RepID=W2T6L3_NECAM|nr:hypothetical protein NECAME_03073 [Necator americanus]ETN77655.1 hypothetical protein NECAME_03073 [Necator americanus]